MASSPSAPAMPAGNVTGAATPRDAIVAFLAAIKAEDLQAMGAIWGTANGPARSQMDMNQLQERELTMICFLHHDTYTMLTDAPSTDGQRKYAVAMTYKKVSHTAQFSVGRASDGRFYVFSVDNITDFQDFCGAK